MANKPWKSIDERVEVGLLGDKCWLWSGAKFNHGYGKVSCGGKQRLVHRVVYETICGPIPDGLQLCHHCDTPLCVRPSHLFVGTVLDNMMDRDRKGRGYDRSGENNGRCRLNWSIVSQMRAAYRKTGNISEVSRKYKVSYSQTREILINKSWVI